MKAIDIIRTNFTDCPQWSGQSFLAQLRDQQKLDIQAYWKLEESIISLMSEFSDYPKELSWPVYQIFDRMMHLLSAHLDPSDNYQIAELEDKQVRELVERVETLFEGFFKGSFPDEQMNLDQDGPRPDWGRELRRAEEIIYQNVCQSDTWAQESFIGVLDRDWVIDMHGYWQLEWALGRLIRQSAGYPRKLTWAVFRIFSSALPYLNAHVSPYEECELRHSEGLPVKEFRKRWGQIFEGFFKGKMPAWKIHGDTQKLPCSPNPSTPATGVRWLPFSEHKEVRLPLGALIKFDASYPFEDQVVMMVCDSPARNSRLGLFTITGYKAGFNCVFNLPEEATNADGSLTAGTLYNNWEQWIGEWSPDRAWILQEGLRADDLK
ncbi:hypothetical protein G5S34_21460 [Herbaspirillum frisingense]|uniref:Imm41 family immunity protein n=1 Tax=Herbaspirillum frisingense TaxID=92645 RepID=UPI0016021676|nr:Imm41 family immunity protein [Herbaspirillum frisingense]QNB09060.1 hypothetical protein G5S34_21460 [Herbaspirillum frisingense]